MTSPQAASAADAANAADATLRALAKPTADATIAHHSKSFSLAAKILPPACRDDAAVVYSYCRRVDDAVDEVAAEAALPAIARLRQELATLYQAAAEPAATPIADPVLARFAAICESRRIPRHYPAELIAGMEMDAVGARYERLEDLLRYAYRVAGVVGLMMCHVMSLRGERALVHAAHLGIAMQLTNICRDVAEDWRRGRLYLPAELLARHGAKDLAAQARDGRAIPASAVPALAAATRELLALADRYYASAERGLLALPWRSAFGVRAARRIYAAIGGRIAAAGHDPLAPRAVVPRWRKLLLVGVAACGALADGRWQRRPNAQLAEDE
ncbi:MAG TPA: phytoene/squalene synthase family protein, partial [Kofleriaceae bacterium]|nr:phytoene/squalene synthase family protein [Kofleriaceae bacterium]